MARLINGKEVALSVIETVKDRAKALQDDAGVTVGLAVVIVGDDLASHAYVGAKSRVAKDCGFTSVQHTLPAETTQKELALLVQRLNADPAVHGHSGAASAAKTP
ncbi:5,10-methylene-tetrahydrofolate dehydrogenase/methenyl tetrahydrofolate cyclohydrolase [Sinorhizobium fredii]